MPYGATEPNHLCPRPLRRPSLLRGYRIRFQDVLELLADNMTALEIVAQSPVLEIEDITACLEYAPLNEIN